MLRKIFNKPKRTQGGSIIEEFAPSTEHPQIGFSDVPPEWQKLREEHYSKFLGETDMVWHEIIPTIPHIDVHVFSPSESLGRKFYTLVTSGMSDEKMTLPKKADAQLARTELIFYIDDAATKAGQTQQPWFVTAIRFFAHFPFKYKSWLGIGHTMPNGNPPSPMVEGSLLNTAIFMPPVFERKEFVQGFKLGSEKINFLWLTFISNEETEYKLKFGIDKFSQKLDQNNFPQVFNPFRPSIV